MHVTSDNRLPWIAESVGNILAAHGIHTHQDLIKAVPLDAATVYRAFPNDDWSGWATMKVLITMARTFRVPMARLVVEPASQVPPRSQAAPRRKMSASGMS